MAQRPTHPTRRRVGWVGFFKGWVPKKPKILPFGHFLQQTYNIFFSILSFKINPFFTLYSKIKKYKTRGKMILRKGYNLLLFTIACNLVQKLYQILNY